MNNFGSEERELLNESVLAYFKDHYPFEYHRELANQHKLPGKAGFSRHHWSEYARLGWIGINISEQAGGAGGGMTEIGILMAACGRYLTMEPFLSTLVMGAGALELAGSAAQQSLLQQVVAGELLLAFCHSEPGSGYDRKTINTIALAQNNNYVINGTKQFALHAQAADNLIVSARLEDGSAALFLVPTTTAGVSMTSAPCLDERIGAAIGLTQVVVPTGARLGKPGQDLAPIIEQVFDRGVLAICAEAVGAMTEVTKQTVEYLKSRQQFGQPLSKMQVLQHRLVDMSIACEETRCIVHAALQAHDQQDADAQKITWQAKVQTARAARFVGGQAIQLHGGMGMTDELAIGHYYKRLVMCETLFGDGQWYLSQLAAA